MPNLIYKIFPSIGIARLGNAAPDTHFVGPEIPGRSAELDSTPFRDAGKIRPQGARFRVFVFDANNPQAAPQEVTLGGDVVAIEWSVHLANKKAFWHNFAGRVGETSPYPSDSLRNFKAGETAAARRKRLIVDPLPRTLNASGASGSLAVTKGNSANPAAETWPGPFADGREITRLGTLFVNADGFLTVVGAEGISGTVDNSPLPHYANNNGWFDDSADGPVHATLQFSDGTSKSAEAAWAIVGPPRFAPSIDCVVTMYDAVFDVAVRHHNFRPALFDSATQKFRTDYEPSFTDEVYPILRSAELVKWLLAEADGTPVDGHHGWNYAKLGTKPFPGGPTSPAIIFNRLRKPSEWHTQVPGRRMPRLHGDAGENSSFLTLTETQYFILSQWKDGNFNPGGVPSTPPATTTITPTGLTRAALDNSVGGAFFPGIEAGWILRDPRIYLPNDPFRIRVLDSGHESDVTGLTPGSATMRSAIPWQADFNDCQDQWWPSHRPTDVLVGTTGTQPERWARNIGENASPPIAHKHMVDKWQQLEFVLSVAGNGQPPFAEIQGGGPAGGPIA